MVVDYVRPDGISCFKPAKKLRPTLLLKKYEVLWSIFGTFTNSVVFFQWPPALAMQYPRENWPFRPFLPLASSLVK